MQTKLPKSFLNRANIVAQQLGRQLAQKILRPPAYNSITYYKDLTQYPYFDALIVVRHYVKMASDVYFGTCVGASNVDLFMMTPSVSSPMGHGSNSEAIPIRFGKLNTYLVDSSQFGFEPLLLQHLDKVYCYLPSMRGEKPDARHLNQFFHCEAEIVGTLSDLTPIMEGYVRALADILLALEPLISRMSRSSDATKKALENISVSSSFSRMSFDDAYAMLNTSRTTAQYASASVHGRTISAEGEKFIVVHKNDGQPLWLHSFDQGTVPFYQKPDPECPGRVINADLLFSPLTEDGFGGEILGAGQRQDTAAEMEMSLESQGVSSKPYAWYLDLRNQHGYKTTSGFGLGIERFIAWSLGYKNIRDVILYPRLKNVSTLP